MSRIYENAFFGDSIRPFSEATVSVASSAVLYGLSVYTVFPVNVTETGELVVFQLHEHYRRLVNSARIIGIDTFEPAWQEERFARAIMGWELLRLHRQRERDGRLVDRKNRTWLLCAPTAIECSTVGRGAPSRRFASWFALVGVGKRIAEPGAAPDRRG